MQVRCKHIYAQPLDTDLHISVSWTPWRLNHSISVFTCSCPVHFCTLALSLSPTFPPSQVLWHYILLLQRDSQLANSNVKFLVSYHIHIIRQTYWISILWCEQLECPYSTGMHGWGQRFPLSLYMALSIMFVLCSCCNVAPYSSCYRQWLKAARIDGWEHLPWDPVFPWDRNEEFILFYLISSFFSASFLDGTCHMQEDNTSYIKNE